MTEYKGYPEYKDSGVEWLGDIPAGWDVVKLANIASNEKNSFTDGDWIESPYITTSGVRLLQTGNIGVGKYKEQGGRFISDETFENLHCTEVSPGDLLICRLADPVGRSAIAPNLGVKMITSVDVCILKPSSQYLTEFFNYVFSDPVYLDWVKSTVRGATRARVSRSALARFRFQSPPLGTQHKIVEFLDRETAHIDAGIANMESLIALLTEKRAALISETVTKGIPGAHAEFKDSGVAWLGEIPVEWETKKVGSLFKNRSEKVSDKDYPALSVTKNGIVPQLSNAAKTDDGDNRKKILKGDFVINSRSDRKGSSGVSPLDGSTSLISTVLIPNGTLVSGYIHHLLRSVDFQEEYYRYGRGIVADLWTTRFSDMKSISLPVPPIQEQERIVEYLTTELVNIDGIIETANSAKGLLKEKRQTLISDAVTGKIDVSNSTH